jgi:uncharacterized membrane protein HdeD (DUF308 family)
MSLATQPGPRDVLSSEREGLRKLWLLMLVLGVVLIAVGLVAMSATFIATLATVLMLGVLFMTGGLVAVVNAFWARRWRGFWVNLLAGFLYLVVGFLMVQRPDKSAEFFTLMIAAALFIGGLFRIAIAVTERFHGWVWTLLNGVISVALGVMIWRDWPESAFWVIGLFVGIDMLFAGWALVMTALAVRDVTAKSA